MALGKDRGYYYHYCTHTFRFWFIHCQVGDQLLGQGAVDVNLQQPICHQNASIEYAWIKTKPHLMTLSTSQLTEVDPNRIRQWCRKMLLDRGTGNRGCAEQVMQKFLDFSVVKKLLL